MNQRIKLVVNELKEQRKVHSAADCARLIGLDKAELSKIMSGSRKVSQRCVDNLLAKFPEINEHWLRLGEGEMFKNVATVDNQSVALAGDEIKENNISVNTDKTISMLVTELAEQRKLTEKVIDQNTDLIAIIAEMNKR